MAILQWKGKDLEIPLEILYLIPYRKFSYKGVEYINSCFLLTPLEKMRFSVRATNRLREMGIKHMFELVTWSEKDLLNVRHLGRRTRNEIVEILADHGVCLGMSFSEVEMELLRGSVAPKPKRSYDLIMY